MNDKTIACIEEIPFRHVADIELPRELIRLYDLAYNLWWSWNPRAREVFSAIDARAWAHYANPVQLLINVAPRQWEPLLESEVFLESAHRAVRELDEYLAPETPTWFGARYPKHDGCPVAYLSMEYGLDQSLALYSGGLGVLSGDHLKSASDLGVPMVAVGLLYRTGYFRQTIDADGHQQHIYPKYDFERLPVRPVTDRTGRDLVVEVPFADRVVSARVWLAQVGRVPLLLLDTDIPANDPGDRPITWTLYVQGRPMRLAQEMVLGIGGAKAIEALGFRPAVWHVNEGHSALLQLERSRRALAEGVGSLAAAMDEIRNTTVFTTHTPVPAGNEQFDHDLSRRYLSHWAETLGVSWPEIVGLGQVDSQGQESNLNLTALALRTSRWANGVSKIHGEVSRSMWKGLFDADDADDTPINHITNGIHLPTWLGPEMRALLIDLFGLNWQTAIHRPDARARLAEIDPARLWDAHQAQKRRLGRFVRHRLREQAARHGRSPEALRAVDGSFRDDALTIGFARRFATYKRASLVFNDTSELQQLVQNEERPVQILFAGKAHPADRPGQELIRHIFCLSQSPEFKGRVVFLEDYDMLVGRRLVQGVDVWLNTPRRPLEASGTSGQKAAANGALNCSILDGWWPEAYDQGNGWAITGEREENGDDTASDRNDAQALYSLLRTEIVPTFFERDDDGRPSRWLEMMTHAIATVAPVFSAERMVRDYTRLAYFDDPTSRETVPEPDAEAVSSV